MVFNCSIGLIPSRINKTTSNLWWPAPWPKPDWLDITASTPSRGQTIAMNIVEFGKFAGDAITRGSAAALELPAAPSRHGHGRQTRAWSRWGSSAPNPAWDQRMGLLCSVCMNIQDGRWCRYYGLFGWIMYATTKHFFARGEINSAILK